MARSYIVGSGFATGEIKVTNEALSALVDTTDQWIRERSGIEERYYTNDETTTSELGYRASVKALEDAKVPKDEIDYIVFATMTPDYFFPGCGSLLQAKLGLKNIPALDIRQQCTGFIYGLQVSDALVRSGVAKTVLLVGAERHSPFMPWQWDYLLGKTKDAPTAEQKAWNTRFRDRTVLFGDAGGAVVIRQTDDENRGLLAFALHADGANAEDLHVPAVGFRRRPYVTEGDLKEGLHIPSMNGRNVFRLAVTRMPGAVREVCQAYGCKLEDIDLVIAHQANLRINEGVQKQLGLPDSKVFNNIQRYGNTTAATIPIAYDECRKSGRIKPGNLVCFVGLGAGLHWGASLMRA